MEKYISLISSSILWENIFLCRNYFWKWSFRFKHFPKLQDSARFFVSQIYQCFNPDKLNDDYEEWWNLEIYWHSGIPKLIYQKGTWFRSSACFYIDWHQESIWQYGSYNHTGKSGIYWSERDMPAMVWILPSK